MRYLLALVLTCIVLVTTASAVGQTDLFTVNNQSTRNIGVVSINYPSGGTSVMVPSAGTYTASVTDVVASITLNGTTIPAQTNAQVIYPAGIVVVIWADSSLQGITLNDMPPG